MSTNTKTAIEREGRPRAGVSRSEPGGRAQRDAGGALVAGPRVEQLPDEVCERLSDELIDELLAGARGEEEIVGPGGLLAGLTRRLVERAMDGELTEHLGYDHGQPPGTRATRRRRRRWRASMARSGSRRPAIARAAVRRRSCRRASAASPALTRRSSRSTRVDCRSATSGRTWRRSTASRPATTWSAASPTR